METEKENSLKGKLYIAADHELITERQYTKEVIFRFNSLASVRS